MSDFFLKKKVQALIASGSKVNTITLAYIVKLDFTT